MQLQANVQHKSETLSLIASRLYFQTHLPEHAGGSSASALGIYSTLTETPQPLSGCKLCHNRKSAVNLSAYFRLSPSGP